MQTRLKKGYLQWRCRRGTKELDVVLTNFLEGSYEVMSDEDLLGFNALLDSQDTVLWYWLSGQQTPDSLDFQAMIKKINA